MNIECLASGSSGNCYKISDGTTTLLLEAGLPIKDIKKWLRFNFSAISGCLITHEHLDHAKSAKELMRLSTDVYMTSGTAKALNLKSHRLKIIKSKEKFVVGSFDILPFDLPHDAAEPVGFYIKSKVTSESLAYITDAMYCKYKFDGLTHLMIEANYDKETIDNNVELDKSKLFLRNRVRKSHMSFEETKNFIKSNDLSKLKCIYLIHLSNANSNEAKYKREIQQMTGIEVRVM